MYIQILWNKIAVQFNQFIIDQKRAFDCQSINIAAVVNLCALFLNDKKVNSCKSDNEHVRPLFLNLVNKQRFNRL